MIVGACAGADGINIPPPRHTTWVSLRVKAAHNKEVKLQCKDRAEDGTKAGRVAPGVTEPHPTETRKLFRSGLGTLLCPSAVSLGIGAAQRSESPAARRSIMSATFDYLRYSAAARVSRPAAIHV